jgi:hypothetical protein
VASFVRRLARALPLVVVIAAVSTMAREGLAVRGQLVKAANIQAE